MKELIYDLTKLSQELLSKDLLYHKIPDSQREHIIEYATQIAQAIAAEKKVKGLHEKSIETFISRYCKIERIDGDVGNAYSDFTYPKNIIHLYIPKIREASSRLESKGRVIDFNKFQNIFLLHEYFHYLEENEIGSLSKQFQIEVVHLFRYSRKSGIRMASEIGANAFVRSIIANPLDYITEGG